MPGSLKQAGAPPARTGTPSTVHAILEALADRPGLHLRGIARATKLTPSHVDYHLHRLRGQGLVTSIQDGGYHHFFLVRGPSNPIDRRDKRLAAALSNRSSLVVLLALLDRGVAGPTELAGPVGRAPSTVQHHLRRLARIGVACETHANGRRAYEVAHPERVRRFLADHPPAADLADGVSQLWDELSLTGRH